MSVKRPKNKIAQAVQHSLWFCLASLFGAPLAAAQDPQSETKEVEERWYQVELIVFSRRPNGDINTPEHKRRDVKLAYPDKWIQVQSVDEYLELQQTLTERQRTLAAANQFFTTDDTSLETETEVEGEAVDFENGQDSPPIEALEPDFSEDTDIQPETSAYDEPGLPLGDENLEEKDPLVVQREALLDSQAYLFLPQEQRELELQADSLRNEGYRVLFHQSWRQAPKEHSQAPALLIQGGGQFGEHRELEGSITISIARYLHLNTDLWLSEFEANYGQGEQQSSLKGWPELPKVPSLLDKGEQFAISAVTNDWQEPSGFFNTISSGNEYDAIIAHPYLTSQVVQLKQKRRMRSKELHYIDHPSLGLVIKLTPYERPIEEENSEEGKPQQEELSILTAN